MTTKNRKPVEIQSLQPL